ncbi:SGNH/GDSL hydrolase family protein [Motilibacter aurantiacus]|uniref:hypothetical protein n=1 Tax=Motilibacter aurantiacus TaxID=2714955 RepID=UPI00140D75D2|nr:hypothetical protein [Motilibacter aurantiacus]NHC46736.1 hypothetical protein [Motilibacter aurantiacus]
MTASAGAAGTAAGAAFVLAVASLTVVGTSTTEALACLPPSVAVSGSVPSSAGLDEAQARNATTIVSEVVQRRMPTRAAVVAIATALQESTLRNLASFAVPDSLSFPNDGVAPGDHDSVGIFQQRAGWGSIQQRMTPTYAAGEFLDELGNVEGWQAMPITVAAQAVQVSAYPDAYAKWEDRAAQIVAGLLGRPTATGTVVAQTVLDAPGLLLVGDDLAEDIRDALPITYQGGAVTLSVANGRTTFQGLADLQARAAALPGTLLVSLGGQDGLDSDADAAAFTSRAKKVLEAGGANRTVYWVTPPRSTRAATALRALANADDRLQLIDVAAFAVANAGWLGPHGGLTEAGVKGVGKLVRNALAENEEDDPVNAGGAGCADGLGGYSGVPVADCTFTLPRGNPRTCQQAIQWALAQQDGPAQWYRRCLNFVAHAYGWSYSGAPAPHHARTFWQVSDHKHPGDLNPPAGALVFWNGGSAGHVALSAGNGMVISNDVRGAGTIALVPMSAITDGWNSPYLGWTDPYFPNGG